MVPLPTLIAALSYAVAATVILLALSNVLVGK